MISRDRIQAVLSLAFSSLGSSDNPRLFILAGFPTDDLKNSYKYLFSKHCVNLEDYLDRNERRRMINEAVAQGNTGGSYWCSFEDYLLLNASVLDEFFELTFLKLPFFKNILPFRLSITNDSRGSENEEDECSTESLSPIFLSDEICQHLEGRISQVYRVNDALFFTTPLEASWKEIQIDAKPNLLNEKASEVEFTITEDEGSWISLYNELMERIPDGVTIGVFISNEYLKNSYADTVRSLELFSNNRITLKTEEVKAAKNHNYDTEQVLRKYWSVPSFRKFLVYRNVRSSGNVKVEEVSQADVIDDILTQVDFAQAGKPHRDIFVTAPTGSGKSLMFQIPSILLHEKRMLTLVISPLIALMNDQVYSLSGKGLHIAATINSSISLSERDSIIQRVQAGEISVLYLSPESLLSRSDIKSLIGERTVGLMVVDEAHIVTTWGKAFRPDYWYLGNYIQRLRKERRFPIATFTATAIYKGPEDMYSETRDSLGMRDPITYFGHIPRKNIEVSFEKNDTMGESKSREYMLVKFSVLASRLEEFKKLGKKVLVYFPFVAMINEFTLFLAAHITEITNDDIVCYHGGLPQYEKKENFYRYKSNASRFMLATKAFGMGIDIPDIDAVYHFAPTGNVCDYIQEIGRAARDDRITGLAKFDYLNKDFTYVNQLYGISTIQKKQLIKVMKKILDIGKAQGNRRNLLISSDDFFLIFKDGLQSSDRESENIDNKVKTALLIIEKDFLLKLGYSPILARPRALFTYAYFQGTGSSGNLEIKKVFGNLQEEKGDCIRVNLKAFWEQKYPNYSFARLKYELYTDPTKFGFSSKDSITPIVIIEIKAGNDFIEQQQANIIEIIVQFCDCWRQSGKYFKQGQLEEYLSLNYGNPEEINNSMLSETILNFLDVWNRTISLNHGKFLTYREDLGYRVIGSGYIDIREFYQGITIQPNKTMYIQSTPDKKYYVARLYALLGLFDSAGFLTYTIQGGENPEIFIRINSYYHLQNVTRDYSRYENIILKNVKDRHEKSVLFLDYLFSNITDQTDRFWALIESYFLGMQPDLDKAIDQELVHIEKITKPHTRLLSKPL